MEASFLFYDIETTGLSRAFDQILEFAAIRTDLNLQEIERFCVSLRLREDVVPSPAAIMVNRICTERFAYGHCEYEAIRLIHREVNRPNTISIGYNSIGFDDEFLRFSFHRNLLPAYTHQFANGCRRMDLLPITIMYWIHRPEVLTWPELNGKISLKLEDLGAANGLFTGQSHDAMSDTEACLRLSRRFIKKGKLWQYLGGSFDGKIDAQRAAELPTAFQSPHGDHAFGLLLASEWGTRNGFLAPVLSIGSSSPYPKQQLWLRLDLANLQQMQLENPAAATWVVRKRFGEPGILLPPQDRYLDRIGEVRWAQTEENLEWLKTHPVEFEALVQYHRCYRYPYIPDLDPDAALYQNGFLSRADEALCREFHAAPLPGKISMIDRYKSRDARTLATRILFRNYPDAGPASLAGTSEAHRRRICFGGPMVDFNGALRITPQRAREEIQSLRQTSGLDAEQQKLLASLEEDLCRRWAIAFQVQLLKEEAPPMP
jgi:exodeoxyribonuclease I